MDDQQSNGLVAIRVMPTTSHETTDDLAGGIMALPKADVVEDDELF